MTLFRLLALTFLLGSTTPGLPARLDASESNGTRAARTLYDQGQAAFRTGEPEKAAALFRKAIEIDADFVEAHQRFIEATRAAGGTNAQQTVGRLRALYQEWATKLPTKAVYTWTLGFLSEEPAKAEAHYLDALRIDPKFARAYFSLARNADLRGDSARQREYLKKAVDSNPADPQYLIRYAHSYKQSDPNRFRELASGVVEKFPESQAAAEALYHLVGSSSGHERLAYVERLKANYPPDRFGYSSLAMDDLFNESTEPAQALSLARDMVRLLPKSKTWARRATFLESLSQGEQLLAEAKFADAFALLEKVDPLSGANASSMLLLIKARAAHGAGQTSRAYDDLADHVARAPDERLNAALMRYAARLQKTPQQVDADLWRIREASATPATPFELTAYADGKAVRLSDYRGRVVLLTFWFPG